MVDARRKILSGLAFAAMLCVAWLFFTSVREYGTADFKIGMDDGWTIYYQDSCYNVSDASKFKIPFKVSSGDTIVLENTLPAYLPDHPLLRFRTYHSAVGVYVDSLLYSYGLNDPRPRPFPGSGIHYVVIPSSATEKRIKVQMLVYADDAFNAFPHFDILPAEKAVSDYNAVHLVEIFIGLFLVLFGIILVLASAISGFWVKVSFRILMIGMVSFLLGVWTLCYLKLIQAFSMDFVFNTILEFYTLYLTPIPFGLLLYDMSKDSNKLWQKRSLKVFVIVGVLFVLTTAVLHLNDVVLIHQTLPFYHLYILVGFLFIMIHVLPFLNKASESGKMLSIGVAIFGVVAFADLLRYNVYKFFMVSNSLFEITWIPLGILLFVVLLIVSYLYYLKDIVSAKTEKDVLASMVYLDSLTGLYNRTKCSQIFDVLEQRKEDFAIISIDMNGLKVVNDRFGHITGDALIKSFGSVFKNAFDGIGATIRMGGDEFIAIIREEHLKDIDQALERLKALEDEASRKTPVRLEAAYGICYRSELGDVHADDVYHAADKRMYDMKMSMKSDLVRR